MQDQVCEPKALVQQVSLSYGFADMGRYGTLVNKQELKGGEANLTEGDLLQFGHKSSFR